MELMSILKPAKYFLIAIICFGLAFVLPPIFPQYTLEDRVGLEINEISASNVTDCYAKEFRLEKGYLCQVEIENYYPNITGRIIFITKEVYLTENASQNDPDGIITRIYFTYARYRYPSSPTQGYSDRYDISTDQSYKFDFMGSGTSGALYSRPGDYIVLIWGDNSTDYTTNENLKFDIKIRVDGLGDLLFNTLIMIGTIVIIAACAITVIYLIFKKKNR